MVASVTTIGRFEELDSVQRSAWDAWAPSPMQSTHWLMNWWRVFGASSRHDLSILLVEDQDGLLGIAPLYISRNPLGIRCLRLLGDGLACSDHSRILVRPGCEEAVLTALTDRLAEQAGKEWDTLTFEAVDAEARLVEQMIERLTSLGCWAERREAAGCWTLQLPGSLEEYLGGLSRNHRKRCRRWLREFVDNGRVEVERCGVDAIEPAWRLLGELNRERRQQVGDRSVFEESDFERFHLSVLPTLLDNELAELRLLKLDGEPVGVEYLLRNFTTFFGYQCGVAQTDGDIGLGNISNLLLIRDAIESGYERVDFLRGDEPYKAHWNAQRAACFDYYLASKSFVGQSDAVRRRVVDCARSFRNHWLPGLGTPAAQA